MCRSPLPANTHAGSISEASALCVLVSYGQVKKSLAIKFKSFLISEQYTSCKPSNLPAGKGWHTRQQIAALLLG